MQNLSSQSSTQDFFTSVPSTTTPCFKSKFENIAILKLYVKSDNPELKQLYQEQCDKHNHQIMNDPFPNSGFDLFIPEETIFDSGVGNIRADLTSKMVNLEVKAEMLCKNKKSCAYFIYPRSSLSKTPLMLANHTGIIDSGYRGFLIGAFRSLFIGYYKVEKHTRLLQICHPSLSPFRVVLVNENDLSTTERGEGGFGSTGLVGV